MSSAYAPSYIEALFDRRDAEALHTVISIRARDARLPDECALFVRVLEWLGADWQYYAALKEEDSMEVRRLLTKFGMTAALAMFEKGRSEPEGSTVLTRWFEAHESEAREELFRRAKQASEFLKKNEG